jgi:hypothetical protein
MDMAAVRHGTCWHHRDADGGSDAMVGLGDRHATQRALADLLHHLQQTGIHRDDCHVVGITSLQCTTLA